MYIQFWYRALILFIQTLALYKSFTYLLTLGYNKRCSETFIIKTLQTFRAGIKATVEKKKGSKYIQTHSRYAR